MSPERLQDDGISFRRERAVPPAVRFLRKIWDGEVVSIPVERMEFYEQTAQRLLQNLAPTQKRTLSSTFGLSGEDPQNISDIARKEGVSRSARYQTVENAMRNVRKAVVTQGVIRPTMELAPLQEGTLGRTIFGEVTTAEVYEHIIPSRYDRAENLQLSEAALQELHNRGIDTHGSIQLPLTVLGFLSKSIPVDNPLPEFVYQEVLEAITNLKEP